MAATHLTTQEFKEKVFDYTKLNENNSEFKFEGEKPAIVDFYADWCGPCKMMSPILDEVEEAYEQIDVYKVNVEEEHEIGAVFGIQSIPSILFIPKDGEPQMAQGAMPKESITHAIENILISNER